MAGLSRRILQSVLLLLMSVSMYAQKREWTNEEKKFLESVNKPISYSVHGMENVKILKNLAYGTTENSNLMMDVFIPSGISQGMKLPVVILVAGGSGKDGEYEPKNWGFYQSYGKMLAASGLVAVTFTHRLGFPELAISEGAEDLEKVIRFVQRHAETYNIDRSKIALITFSGGGPLLSVGLTGKIPDIKCLIAVYSILDVRENEFALKSVSEKARKQFSPITYIKEGATIPALLVIRAGRDGIPNLNMIMDRFIQNALAANLNIELLNHPAGVHGFENKGPDPRTSGIIKRMVEFLKEHLF